jgi:hypothetical protein
MIHEEFVARIETQLRIVPWLHSLHSPASPEELERWAKAHTGYFLPADVLALYQLTNGFSLHHIRYQTEIVGEAFVVPPLNEIGLIGQAMYGQRDRRQRGVPSHWLTVGRHTDGNFYVALDTKTSTYRTIAPIVPEEADIIGTNCTEYLDWMTQFLPEDDELRALAEEHAT